MLQDVRHAIRLMATQKAFTAAALITLALGIGVTTAIFSMVYGVLLRPLPYATADRVVRLSEAHPGGTAIVRVPVLSNVTFNAWRRKPQTIQQLAAYTETSFTLLDRNAAQRVRGTLVAPAMFALLGTRPAAGRLLQEQDASPAAPRVAVISGGFWQERYGGDASAIGGVLTLDGQPHTIVGITSAEFYFPDRETRIWVPFRVADTPANGRLSIFAALGLLRPGMTPEQAAAEGTSAARSVGPRHQSANLLFGNGGPVTVTARPLLEEITGRVRPALVVLLVSVALVLLMACANVANLLLSRGVARRRELAVRAALGARRGRLARQLLTETLVLSLAGGALGLGAGILLTLAIPSLAPENFPRLGDIRIDRVALAFAVSASVAAGLIAGALPAWRVGRGGLLPALREGAGASRSAHARRVGTALLVAEAAVAVMLLIAAGLLGRSFVRLLHVDPGYDAANVLMARVYLPPRAEGEDVEERFADAVLDRVRALPGVTAAGAANMAPLAGMSAVMSFTLEGDSATPVTARARSYVITPGYIEALSIRVRQGRAFDRRDLSAGIRPILINEEFARTHFRNGTPVGRRFKASFAPDAPVEIVGVVANVLKDGLDTAPEPEIYNLPRDSFGFPPSLNLAIRTAGDPLALIGPVRQAVRDLAPAAAVDEVETLGSRVSASVSEPRFAMAILALFAGLAVVLAAVGLYGVLSYQVVQRRRELGVRAALGASRGSLVALVMRQGVIVAAAGIVVGLIGAAWLAQLLQGLLFGITRHDAVAFSTAPVLLLLVAIAATLIPARRAARADPIEVLRSE